MRENKCIRSKETTRMRMCAIEREMRWYERQFGGGSGSGESKYKLYVLCVLFVYVASIFCISQFLRVAMEM